MSTNDAIKLAFILSFVASFVMMVYIKPSRKSSYYGFINFVTGCVFIKAGLGYQQLTSLSIIDIIALIAIACSVFYSIYYLIKSGKS